MEYFVGSDTATERGASSSSEWDLVDSLENTQPADEGTLTSATLSSDGDAVISIPFTACAADVANYEQAINSYENRSEQDHESHDGGIDGDTFQFVNPCLLASGCTDVQGPTNS